MIAIFISLKDKRKTNKNSILILIYNFILFDLEKKNYHKTHAKFIFSNFKEIYIYFIVYFVSKALLYLCRLVMIYEFINAQNTI